MAAASKALHRRQSPRRLETIEALPLRFRRLQVLRQLLWRNDLKFRCQRLKPQCIVGRALGELVNTCFPRDKIISLRRDRQVENVVVFGMLYPGEGIWDFGEPVSSVERSGEQLLYPLRCQVRGFGSKFRPA